MTHRRTPFSVLLYSVLSAILLTAVACQVEDADRSESAFGEPFVLEDECRTTDDYEFRSIEDFELGIGRLWWVSSDNSGEIYPLPGREPEAVPIEGGLCGTSRYALHLKASGLNIYGGGLGINFFPSAVDASRWDGISFWARRGAESSRTLFVALSEKHTDEENGQTLQDDGHSYCRELPEDETEKCDRFGTGVGLGTQWRFFTLPFEQMKQRGFGTEAPFLDLENLIGLNISFETGDWDIWIDEVSFYRLR